MHNGLPPATPTAWPALNNDGTVFHSLSAYQTALPQIALLRTEPLFPQATSSARQACEMLAQIHHEYTFHLVLHIPPEAFAQVEAHLDEYAHYVASVTLVPQAQKPQPGGTSGALRDALCHIRQDYGLDLIEAHHADFIELKTAFANTPFILMCHDGGARDVQAAKKFFQREGKTPDMLVFTSSSAERNAYTEGPSTLIPMGFSAEGQPLSRHEPKIVRALWSANFERQENADGMHWFTQQVLPHLRRTAPEGRLSLALSGTGAAAAAAAAGLHDAGELDLHPEHMEIFFAPFLDAHGARAKILRVMGMGIPVVVTSQSVAGLYMQHKRHAWVADSPESFAEGISSLLADPALRKRLSENGREFVHRNYPVERSINARRNLYSLLLYQHAPSDAAKPESVSKMLHPAKAGQTNSPYRGLTYLKPIECREVTQCYSRLPAAVPFSVIIPVKNEAAGLPDFLRDLSSQTVQASEIIIVDHDSTDNSVALVQEYAKSLNLPLKLLHAKDRRPPRLRASNVAGNRNYAVEQSTNDILVFADAGTRLSPQYFANIVGPLVDNPDADVCGGIFTAQTKELHWKLIWDWESIPWNIFLPTFRAMAMRRHLFDQVGGIPEFLSFAGEDTLFDIWIRRSSTLWLFNKHAEITWFAPENDDDLWQKYFRYGIGDGESGVGDFFHHERNLSLNENALSSYIQPDITLEALFQGYLAGKQRRGEIDRERRNVSEVILFPVEKHLSQAPSTLRIIKRLIEENKRVITVIADTENVQAATPVYLDFDISLFEAHYMRDFSMEKFLCRYGHPDLRKTTKIVEDPENRSDRTKKFILWCKAAGIL